MVDQEHGEPVRIELLDQFPDTIFFCGVHSGRGLIEDQQSRLQRQRPRDLEPPLIAIGQRRRTPVAVPIGIEAHALQELAGLVDALPVFFS